MKDSLLTQGLRSIKVQHRTTTVGRTTFNQCDAVSRYLHGPGMPLNAGYDGLVLVAEILEIAYSCHMSAREAQVHIDMRPFQNGIFHIPYRNERTFHRSSLGDKLRKSDCQDRTIRIQWQL